MAALKAALEALVATAAADRGVVALAVCTDAGSMPIRVWLPADCKEEPRFLAYSITKTLTAALALVLAERGELDIDAPIARWLPQVPSADRISMRMLLNNTAGIPDYGGLPAYREAVRSSPSQAWTFARYAAETFDKGLDFEPGQGWSYSNPGFMLANRILESLTGDSFAAMVADRIAAPLGLTRTCVARSTLDLAELAFAPSRSLAEDGEPLDTRAVYDPGWVSHGVVAAPPSEIAVFYASLFAGRLLGSAALEQMRAGVPVPAAPPQWVRPHYGLGLMIDETPELGMLLGHNGSGPGYAASAFHAPAIGGGATVCAMCTAEGTDLAEELVREALATIRDMKAGPS